MKRVILAFLILFATSMISMAEESPIVGGPNPDVPSFIGYAPNRIVVKFDPSTTKGLDIAAMKRGETGISALDVVGTMYGVQSLRPQFPGAKKKIYKGKVVDLSGWHEVEFAGKADVLAAVKHYKAIPGVIDAQPVGIHKVNIEPNDYNYINPPTQWHLAPIVNRDSNPGSPNAWDIADWTRAGEIIVAVLDTGVRYYHGDLGGKKTTPGNEPADPAAATGNMWINPDVDVLKNDWIGWDWVNVPDDYPVLYCYPGEDCLTADNDPRDFQGHGTHCAGNVANMTNNLYNLASVAGGWGNGSFESGYGNGVQVMDLRIGWRAIYVIFDVGVVDMGFAAQALHYAADHGARIASCSWGSSQTGALEDAIAYFLGTDPSSPNSQNGGLIFKAAGNDSTETADFMCGLDGVLCVAATDQNGCKASFSTYGTWVDISAPGVWVCSSWHNADIPDKDYWACLDGTSMSTPLAASVAALIWAQNPDLHADDVKQRLLDSADPSIYSNTCNLSFDNPRKLGTGLINAYHAISGEPPPSPNSPPVITSVPAVTATPNPVKVNEQSNLSVTASDPDGDTLSYLWSATGGSIEGTGSTVTYTPPQVTGTYRVDVTVSDGHGGSVTGSVNMTVEPADGTSPFVGVDSLEIGKYGGRGKNSTFETTSNFNPGDEVIIQVWVVDTSNNAPVVNATVSINILGPFPTNEVNTVITSVTDGNGFAEAKWKTSAPKGKKSSGGTPLGDYTVSVPLVIASGYVYDYVNPQTGICIGDQCSTP